MLKSDRCTVHRDFYLPVSMQHSSYISSTQKTLMLQCFFFFFFSFFHFYLRLKEQQAVTAPWALTDHSLQSGCQRCRLGSATLHKGAVRRVSEVAVLC